MKTFITEATPGLDDAPQGGTILVRIIDAGEGSSGYYSSETLRQAAADRVFPEGLHMYVDHAGEARRGVNGERSLRDLGGVLVEDAAWDEQAQALTARARLYSWAAQLVREAADDIGVSISAWAETSPGRDAEGRERPVIDRITAAESVDFVVAAGRGGRVLAVLESLRAAEASAQQTSEQLQQAVTQAVGGWVTDWDPDERTVVYRREDDPGLWQQRYETGPGGALSLAGAAVRVRAVTTYLPADTPTPTPTTTQTGETVEISDTDYKALKEAADKTATLETQLAEATERAEKAEQGLAEQATKARTSALHAALDRATRDLPDPMAARVRAAWPDTMAAEADLPADLDARIAATVDAEKAYVASLTETPRLSGFGASTTTDAAAEAAPARTVNAFGRPITH